VEFGRADGKFSDARPARALFNVHELSKVSGRLIVFYRVKLRVAPGITVHDLSLAVSCVSMLGQRWKDVQSIRNVT
jgi:hypothetical protein